MAAKKNMKTAAAATKKTKKESIASPPKGMKKVSVEKKKEVKKVDPVQEKIALIEDNIEKLCQDARVTDLVIKLVKPSLQDFVEFRHPFQLRTVDMIQEVLVMIEQELAAETAGKQQIIDSADSVRATLKSELEGILAAITAKETSIEEFEKVLAADNECLSDCIEKKAAAQDVYDELKVERAANADATELATKGQAEFDDMVQTTPEVGKAGKRRMMEFTSILKKIACDDSLMQAAPSALNKAVEDRGMFDKVTIDSIAATFKAFLEDLSGKAASQDEKEASAFADIEKCRAAETEADSKVRTSESELSTAQSELKQLKKDKKEKDSVIDNHETEVMIADGDRDEAAAAETAFAEVFTAFRELKDRTEIVPEVVEEEKMDVEEPEVVEGEVPAEMEVESPEVAAAPAVEEVPSVEFSPEPAAVEEVNLDDTVEEVVPQEAVAEEEGFDSENQDSGNAVPVAAEKAESPQKIEQSPVEQFAQQQWNTGYQYM